LSDAEKKICLRLFHILSFSGRKLGSKKNYSEKFSKNKNFKLFFEIFFVDFFNKSMLSSVSKQCRAILTIKSTCKKCNRFPLKAWNEKFYCAFGEEDRLKKINSDSEAGLSKTAEYI
jgi:hypothetical protein